MFSEQKQKKNHYEIETENLAIPEIHTGKVKSKPDEPSQEDSIIYDTVAVPEIHIKKPKKEN